MQKKLLRIFLPLLIVVFLTLLRNDSPVQEKAVLSSTPTPFPIVTQATASALVTKVVDGDTIHVTRGEEKETIRLIGVDTPELHDPRKPVECFAKEAQEALSSWVNGKEVTLQADPTQSNRDIYGRLLRYIFLSDKTLINQKLIREGYAHEYTYDLPYRYQQEFKQAEKIAQQQQIGLWKPGLCDNK